MEHLGEVKNDRRFQVGCDAGGAGRFCAGTDSLSVKVGLRVERDGVEEIWDAVVVLCQEESDGILAVRVLLCNLDWDEPLQIACVRSRPGAGAPNIPAWAWNFNHAGT